MPKEIMEIHIGNEMLNAIETGLLAVSTTAMTQTLVTKPTTAEFLA